MIWLVADISRINFIIDYVMAFCSSEDRILWFKHALLYYSGHIILLLSSSNYTILCLRHLFHACILSLYSDNSIWCAYYMTYCSNIYTNYYYWHYCHVYPSYVPSPVLLALSCPSLYCMVWLCLLLCTVSLPRACQPFMIVQWHPRRSGDINSDSSGVYGVDTCRMKAFIFVLQCWWLSIRRMHWLPGATSTNPH